jgi:hypothetical protein
MTDLLLVLRSRICRDLPPACLHVVVLSHNRLYPECPKMDEINNTTVHVDWLDAYTVDMPILLFYIYPQNRQVKSILKNQNSIQPLLNDKFRFSMYMTDKFHIVFNTIKLLQLTYLEIT